MSAAPFVLAALLSCALGSARAEPPPLSDPAVARAPAGAEAADSGPGQAALIDLNSADSSQLESLPGIGPSRARAILAFRAAHGGFHSVSQLLSIKGIGRALLRKLRTLVTVSAAPQKPHTSIGSS